MIPLGRFLVVALALPACWWGTALAGDTSAAEQPTAPVSRSVPDLRLSVSETPGETTLRVPMSSENALLYGLLSPYLSLGANASLNMPWNPALPSSLRNDPEGPESDLRLGAGVALPLSDRAQLYGEYRFLRGRLDSGVAAAPRCPQIRGNSAFAFCSSAACATRANGSICIWPMASIGNILLDTPLRFLAI